MSTDFSFPEIKMDFEQDLSKDNKAFDKSFTQGDKLTGSISKISKSGIFINLDYHCEGFITYEEMMASESQWNENDEITAYFVEEKDSLVILTTQLAGDVLDSALQEAFDKEIPLEGEVIGENKGGFRIKLAKNEAFCPYSQIDIYSQDNENYIGQTYTFIITKFSESDLVVSRRKILQKEAVDKALSLQETLKEGDELDGVIRRIEKFGFFVDLGGADGLVHKSELSWNRKFDLNDYFKVNDKVNVVIRSLDWISNRIKLGLREKIANPWQEIAKKFAVGEKYNGKIISLTTFGAFIELEKNFEGLLHISKIKEGKKINHPSEFFEIGQEVEVFIENIDSNSERISLSLRKEEKKPATQMKQEKMQIGKVYEGTIDGIKPFGIFVRLNKNETGLLHISKMNIPNHLQTLKELEQRFALGSKINIIIDRIKDKRISFSLPKNQEDLAQEQLLNEYMKPKETKGGNFASAFDNLDL